MGGLLENILKISSLNYISDLSGRIEETSVKDAVKQIRIEDYELKEWTDAIRYLTGGHKRLLSQEDIRKYVEEL